MPQARLTRTVSQGVTLLGDERRPGGVTFAFTERTGGVSEGAYASLNLGDACGDDPDLVAQNRRLALRALGAEALESRLVNPRQVHGTEIVTIEDGSAEAVERAVRHAREGADAVVCTAPDVPVLLCYADCVPVVLVAPGAFAVVHSGWRGTIARIGGLALKALCEAAQADPSEVLAYVGPHVGGPDYEVSEELAAQFEEAFGQGVRLRERCVDLAAAIVETLVAEGVDERNIAVCDDSTVQATDRFYSYRASGGACGRHGALAVLPGALMKGV